MKLRLVNDVQQLQGAAVGRGSGAAPRSRTIWSSTRTAWSASIERATRIASAADQLLENQALKEIAKGNW